MKKTLMFSIIILAMVFAMLPTGKVYAAKPAPMIKITLINRTKGPISMHVIGPDGLHYSYDFPNALTNEYTIYLPQAQYYSTYIQTACDDTIISKFNGSRNRQIKLICDPKGNLTGDFHAPVGQKNSVY